MRRLLCLILCLSLLGIPVRATPTVKYAALTFDDGPSGRFTRRLLDGLAQRQTHATFFLCGYRLEQMPEEARRIRDEGHEIGLHGYSHDNMSAMSRRQIAAELEKTLLALPGACQPVWLRPPGGCCSDGVRQVARAKGLAIAQWSLDPRDWATSDTDSICRCILQNIRDGDVILLHDMSDSSVDAALTVIDTLTPQGWRFVTLSQLARLRGYSPEAGQILYRLPPDTEKQGVPGTP